VPLRGPASLPFRMFGIRPSRMNPNTCTVCELMFTRVMKARSSQLNSFGGRVFCFSCEMPLN
jgi:hypothetical protein